MKKIIEYYEKMSDHILAMPKFSRKEYVEVDSEEKLKTYIESKK